MADEDKKDNRPLAYVHKDPGDIIRAGDWNELQVRTREEIHGHRHSGDADGTQIPREGIEEKAIDGSRVDPQAELAVKSLKIGESLQVTGTTTVGGDLRVTGGTFLSGDLTVSGSGLRNTSGNRLLETNRDDWLRINPDQEFPAIAMYKPVALGTGGLTVGEWNSDLPAGQLKVTKDAFLATNGGNVGIGTVSPGARLHVNGDTLIDGRLTVKGVNFENSVAGHIEADGALYRFDGQAYLTVDDNFYIRDKGGDIKFYFQTDSGDLTTGNNPLKFSSKWSNFPAGATKKAEISNDTDGYKTLMIVGNRSGGGARRVGVWDELDVRQKPVPVGDERLRLLRGSFNADGNLVAGGGLNGSKVDTGLYDITFSSRFSSPPTVVVTQHYNASGKGGNTLDNSTVVDVTTTKCRIKTGEGGGKASNRAFQLLVMGPV